MRLLDLFSGIGGFSLGLERAGFTTAAFCEIEPYCQRVLAKHWPKVPIYDDIRKLTAGQLAADGIAVDAICGGFPCQDISLAGAGAGIDGERSGLWREYARLIGELRPSVVFVENVAALLGRGLDRVLGDLAALGYDAEWDCIPASALGAPHRRDRLWLTAYPHREGEHDGAVDAEVAATQEPVSHSDSDVIRVKSEPLTGGGRPSKPRGDGTSWHVAHANGSRLSLSRSQQNGADWIVRRRLPAASDWWAVEPDLDRVAYGIPHRMDRIRALGNAVVPQVTEYIGRRYLEQFRSEEMT